jgi:hypothetical protein
MQLKKTVPRLSVWSDNVLKLYAILDSIDGNIFGKLPVSEPTRTINKYQFNHFFMLSMPTYNVLILELPFFFMVLCSFYIFVFNWSFFLFKNR